MDNQLGVIEPSLRKKKQKSLRAPSLRTLQKKVKKLQDICQHLDPYSAISDEMRTELNSLGLYTLDDPFVLTKQLILLMEDTLEELEKKKGSKNRGKIL